MNKKSWNVTCWYATPPQLYNTFITPLYVSPTTIVSVRFKINDKFFDVEHLKEVSRRLKYRKMGTETGPSVDMVLFLADGISEHVAHFKGK